mmetsp:Transcript_45269/g.113485  ORF Transcript_45269/g.113485 Transcript_45269/m.113485 type:complete len:222 (+) Transcript_45269:1196-1861(+)
MSTKTVAFERPSKMCLRINSLNLILFALLAKVDRSLTLNELLLLLLVLTNDLGLPEVSLLDAFHLLLWQRQELSLNTQVVCLHDEEIIHPRPTLARNVYMNLARVILAGSNAVENIHPAHGIRIRNLCRVTAKPPQIDPTDHLARLNFDPGNCLSRPQIGPQLSFNHFELIQSNGDLDDNSIRCLPQDILHLVSITVANLHLLHLLCPFSLGGWRNPSNGV